MGLSMAVVAILSTPAGTKPSAFHMWTSPLPLWFAILMAVMWGIAIPIISWRWHRVVDEHESRAYRDGALAAFYVVGSERPSGGSCGAAACCLPFRWNGYMAR